MTTQIAHFCVEIVYRSKTALRIKFTISQEDFQTNTSQMAHSANQILSQRASANHRATLKYQFKISSQLATDIWSFHLVRFELKSPENTRKISTVGVSFELLGEELRLSNLLGVRFICETNLDHPYLGNFSKIRHFYM